MSTNKSAAFFDLDKTIIAKAAIAAFQGPLYAGGLLSRRAIARVVLAEIVYLHLGASDERLARIRESLLRLSKGWDKEEVSAIIEETFQKIVEPIIYAEALDLIELHQSQGQTVVIVSAAPEEIVAPMGRHLQVETTISSRVAVDDENRYTGEMAFYAYGRDKALAIASYAKDNAVDLSASYAYSDSIADLPMLDLVGHPVVVNPDRALSRIAREREWDVRNFVQPVRLRDRVRGRVQMSQRRSTLAVSFGTVVVMVGSWFVFRRHRAPEGREHSSTTSSN